MKKEALKTALGKQTSTIAAKAEVGKLNTSTDTKEEKKDVTLLKNDELPIHLL